MKGSAFALLGCFALFLAAPSRSYSISEDDQLANRRDTRSGSPSTDAATSGDAVKSTDTSAGESETVEMIGDADPGNESAAGVAQAGKYKIRKRDTRSLVRDEVDEEEEPTGLLPIPKDDALYLFRQLGKYGGNCLEQAFNYIEEHELPEGLTEDFFPEAKFTWSHMISWLRIMDEIVSECMAKSIGDLDTEYVWKSYGPPPPVGPHTDSDTFANVPAFLSPLIEMAKRLRKCFDDALKYLEGLSSGPGDTFERSSESLPDLLTELIGTLALIDGGVVPAGGTVPMFPPGVSVVSYASSVPGTTTYKKRNSLDKPRKYPHYTNLPGPRPHYIYAEDNSNSIVRQFSGFRGGAAQIPYTPGKMTLPENVYARPTQQLSLLNVVLDKIYSKLQRKVPPGVNMEAAPVEGLRVDANGALGLYPGSGEGPAMGDAGLNPECVHKRVR